MRYFYFSAYSDKKFTGGCLTHDSHPSKDDLVKMAQDHGMTGDIRIISVSEFKNQEDYNKFNVPHPDLL